MEILLRNDNWEFSFKVNEKTGDMLLKNPKYASAILESINKEHNTDYSSSQHPCFQACKGVRKRSKISITI